MILSDLKKYVSQYRIVTLSDMAIHFDKEPDAIRGMLEHWIRKGKIRKIPVNGSCQKTCSKCNSVSAEVYEWTG